MLLVIKDFGGRGGLCLVTVRNASMQRVGTKVGTVRSDEIIGRSF